MILTSLVFLFASVDASSHLLAKIVGGNNVDIKLVPYQVSLQFKHEHICGGAIISTNSVLTAAHCVDGSLPSLFSVNVGSSYRFGGLNFQVKTLTIHENYNSETSENDIAIVTLRERLPFYNAILPVALPKPNETVTGGTQARISGWGHIKEGGRISFHLKQVYVPIIDRQVCRKMYGTKAYISDTMICGGYLQGGKDACQGDSGGPLVANGKLHGVISWGFGCARAQYPGVYTEVSKYRNWIKNKVGI